MKNTVVARIRALVRRVFFWLPSASPSEEYRPEMGHDHALVMSVKQSHRLPTLRQIRYGIRVVLSTAERRVLLYSAIAFVITTAGALVFLVQERTIRVPVAGGSIREGVIGEPKYLNPLDAPANDVDRDIVSLVYSGLFRMNGTEAVPDLAESFAWSDDGKTLTVTLRADARFHNGDEVTADDVQYTIDAIQDPARTSPLAALFRGIKAIATDTHTIQIVQEQPDVTLLQTLTVGILPSRIWGDIPPANARLADLNIKPIGSGPYRFKSFTRDSRGFVRAFTLEKFDHWYGIMPYIKTVTFQFYPDRKQAEDALKADLIDALAFSSLLDGNKNSSLRWNRLNLELPQETIAFFNVKHKTLADEKIRRALAGTIDRQEIIDAWNGRATSVSGPYPFATASTTIITLDEGRALLDSAGWVLPEGGSVRVPKGSKAATATSTASNASTTEFELTVITSEQPELVAVAETLKRRWSLIGAKVSIEALSQEELLRRATRERTASVVLTNILLDQKQDLFPFWWSGQATDRGLNISNLTDRDVDAALEKTRTASTTDALNATRAEVEKVILRSTPAAFLVRPYASYLIAKKIHGVSEHLVVSRPADRFQDLLKWHVKSGWRWK
ncbi:MAG: ABC transporter substrate-binding protein [Patescibacteria group bacterium]|jgi:peptide/nickel transport system substrate-binding protein